MGNPWRVRSKVTSSDLCLNRKDRCGCWVGRQEVLSYGVTTGIQREMMWLRLQWELGGGEKWSDFGCILKAYPNADVLYVQYGKKEVNSASKVILP